MAYLLLARVSRCLPVLPTLPTHSYTMYGMAGPLVAFLRLRCGRGQPEIASHSIKQTGGKTSLAVVNANVILWTLPAEGGDFWPARLLATCVLLFHYCINFVI